MTDNEMIEFWEDIVSKANVLYGEEDKEWEVQLSGSRARATLDLLKRQQAEIDRKDTEIDILIRKNETLKDEVSECNAEIERLQAENECADGYAEALVEKTRAEAIKEFAEKTTEIFMRYAHIHNYADIARRDYIEAGDGHQIEMQSVWDAFMLSMG